MSYSLCGTSLTREQLWKMAHPAVSKQEFDEHYDNMLWLDANKWICPKCGTKFRGHSEDDSPTLHRLGKCS